MKRRQIQPGGVAMFLVIAAVAIATVLGMVMLSTATLANAAGGNQAKLVTTEYLGESGINLALYYLQHPPSGNPQNYWTGTGGAIAIGTSGTVDVSVVPATDDVGNAVPYTYEVTANATAGVSDPISRQYRARVVVQTAFQTSYSSTFNSAATLYGRTTINGGIYVAGRLTSSSIIGLGLPITGPCYATDFNLLGTLFYDKRVLKTPVAMASPTLADINLYKTYTYQGTTRYANVLTSSTISGTLGPADPVTNPAQIWYYNAKDTPLTLGAGAVINGTLVVDQGDVQVSGAGISINPAPGYPALIATHDLVVAESGNSLTVNGVVFVGNQLRQIGSTPLLGIGNSTLTINGALLSGSTGTPPIASGWGITTNLIFNQTTARAPDITSNPALRQPVSVSIQRWGPP
jgi:hypothetical protein